MKKENQIILTDQEKIILSRIYKLDKKIETFIKNRPNESTNKILTKTDFIKQANNLYKETTSRVRDISRQNTKYVYNLINID